MAAAPPGQGQAVVPAAAPLTMATVVGNALAVPGNNDAYLMVGGNQLANMPGCHSAQSRAALALPGQPVRVRRQDLTRPDRVHQIQQGRQSYMNAIIIQSRGGLVNPPCTQCAGRLDAPAPPGVRLKAFPECRRLPGHWHGGCGNCKWTENALGCSVRDASDDDDDDDNSGDYNPQGGAANNKKRKRGGKGNGKGRTTKAIKGVNAPGSSAANAIVIS